MSAYNSDATERRFLPYSTCGTYDVACVVSYVVHVSCVYASRVLALAHYLTDYMGRALHLVLLFAFGLIDIPDPMFALL